MSNRNLSLALKLYADATRFVAGLTQAESRVHRFGGAAKREFDALKGAFGSLQGQLATLGVTVGGVATVVQSAKLDKSLTQIGQTAGVSREEVDKLRRDLFRMAGDTGQSVENLQEGFGELVAAGLSFRESSASIGAINDAMSISTVSASQLAGALTVASTAFNFDLSKPGKAVELLDKMTVAGGLGSAELDKLPDIFARVGVNAQTAGMSVDKTLAFIETLSKIEKQPERLATLADSTLRLFTNLNYMRGAQKATGVKFFDANGERRDAFAVLADIKAQYDKLGTDKARALYVQKAFGKTDLDTIKGIKTLLGDGMLQTAEDFAQKISGGAGEVARRQPDALNNAVDQTGRLKNKLREAADAFAAPINETLTNVIKWGLDDKKNGGLGLDGKDMIGGGAALAVGTVLAARYGGKALSGLAKRFGGTAAGLAEGKALEAAAGVTPVFVVNWPASIGGGAADLIGSGVDAARAAGAAGGVARTAGSLRSLAVLAGGLPLSAWGSMGAAGMATAAGGVLAAGAGGYALGSAINAGAEWAARGTRFEGMGTDVIGGAIAKTLAFFGNEEAQRAVAMTEKLKQAEVGGEIRVKVDQDGRLTSVSARTTNPRVPMNVDAGYGMVMP